MTDQPKQGKDEAPEGYGPPPHIPSQDPYGQPGSPYGTAYPAPTQQPYGAPGSRTARRGSRTASREAPTTRTASRATTGCRPRPRA